MYRCQSLSGLLRSGPWFIEDGFHSDTFPRAEFLLVIIILGFIKVPVLFYDRLVQPDLSDRTGRGSAFVLRGKANCFLDSQSGRIFFSIGILFCLKTVLLNLIFFH